MIMFVLSFYFYAHFPARVATHWDLEGNPNKYSSAFFAAFFFPTLTLGLFLLLSILPRIDPRKENNIKLKKTIEIFTLILISFLATLYVFIGISSMHHVNSLVRVIPILVGILFIVLGIYLPSVKSNWFVGIRTPWTLSSETVWNKTHVFGGKVFILAGSVMILGAFVPVQARVIILIASTIVAVIAPIAYSYKAFEREKFSTE